MIIKKINYSLFNKSIYIKPQNIRFLSSLNENNKLTSNKTFDKTDYKNNIYYYYHYLKNNAKIESAEIAIATYNSANPTSSTYYGGIIVAHDTEFHNNIVSIDMHPFDVSPSNTDDDNVDIPHKQTPLLRSKLTPHF